MDKKKYETPKLDIIGIEVENVITESSIKPTPGPGELPID